MLEANCLGHNVSYLNFPTPETQKTKMLLLSIATAAAVLTCAPVEALHHRNLLQGKKNKKAKNSSGQELEYFEAVETVEEEEEAAAAEASRRA